MSNDSGRPSDSVESIGGATTTQEKPRDGSIEDLRERVSTAAARKPAPIFTKPRRPVPAPAPASSNYLSSDPFAPLESSQIPEPTRPREERDVPIRALPSGPAVPKI